MKEAAESLHCIWQGSSTALPGPGKQSGGQGLPTLACLGKLSGLEKRYFPNKLHVCKS